MEVIKKEIVKVVEVSASSKYPPKVRRKSVRANIRCGYYQRFGQCKHSDKIILISKRNLITLSVRNGKIMNILTHVYMFMP